jgi:hypothetical protein
MAKKIIKLPQASHRIGIEGRHMEKMGIKVSPQIIEGNLGKPLFIDMIDKGQAEIYSPEPDDKSQEKDDPGEKFFRPFSLHNNGNISKERGWFKGPF